MTDEITSEIVGLISSENVVGLATHRHYPRERIIYSRFGRCGFAIDVVKLVAGSRVLYSILVEAEAENKSEVVQDFFMLPGKVVYTLSEQTPSGRTIKRKTATYQNGEELFSRVEEVRRAFYSVYSKLKEQEKTSVAKIGEELFHSVGLTADELHLGV
ncbi:MAG: hypothetical protein N0A16_13855 [Blastocatellia bacterium]|nr:hypothetical protein [Blastocatellia bacterium]